MPDDLYFVPLIAAAMEDADSRASLRRALASIEELGRQERFARGYGQFLHFVAMVRQHKETLDSARPIDSLEPSAVLATLAALSQDMARPGTLELLVFRDEQLVGGAPLPLPLGTGATAVISGLRSGRYRLELDTGRVLWEGTLADIDLIWSAAFPHRPLAAAADTGHGEMPSSRQLSLMDGTLRVLVIPGLESGALSVRVAAPSGR